MTSDGRWTEFTHRRSGDLQARRVERHGDEDVVWILRDYKLIAANIDNAVFAHIHLAPAGVNGPVVAFLFGPVAAGGGRSSGVLAEGTLTADDLVGPLAGQLFTAVVDAVRAGNTYVNVQTDDGAAPGGTGPGDLSAGEIRGQIR